MSRFLNQVVVDETGTPLALAAGQIFSILDLNNTTPLKIYDNTGAAYPLDQLVANDDGVTPEFSTDSTAVVKWVSGAYSVGMIAWDLIPSGGFAGQVLAKTSSMDYDLRWMTPTAGVGGGTEGIDSAFGINARDIFNAKGDGIADDTAAIQAAFDSITGTFGPCNVYLPGGDYVTSGPIIIRTDGTKLTGDGAGNRTGATQGGVGTRIKAKAGGFTGSQMILVQRTANDRPVMGVHFADIAIDGSSTGAGVNGVLYRSNQGSMTNVHIWNMTGVGIKIQGYTTPTNWDTYDSRFSNVIVGYCGVAGVELSTGGADTMWANCIFLSNLDNMVVRGSSPQFVNCHFYTALRHAIWFDGNGTRAKFANCKIEGSADHLVNIDSTNGGYSDIQFTGCGFSSLNQAGVTNSKDYLIIQGPSTIGVSRTTLIGNSFNLKGGSTVKARYAVNLASSAAQGTVIIGNSFGPASHWGTAPLNNASASAILPTIKGNAGLPDLILANVQTVTAYTLAYSDAGGVVEVNTATAATVTIPTAATSGLLKGNVIDVVQTGAGAVTIAAATGVTLNMPTGATATLTRYARVRLRMTASNVWILESGTGGTSTGGTTTTAARVDWVRKSGTTWPARPTADASVMVFWVGADPSPAIVNSGTGGMLNNVDIRLVTP